MTRCSMIRMVSLALLLGFVGCGTEDSTLFYSLDGIMKNHYYESEIFSESNRGIYGTWKLFGVSGGLAGDGHGMNFDLLVIREYGIYGFTDNDRILENGKINIAEQTGESLLITFEPDDQSGTVMGDPEKYVNFHSDDTLSLDSPCCDRYNYHLARVK